jgi:hypothetical protein
MSAERLETPQPVCEKCWLKDHTQWEPESVGDDGDILFRLKGVDVPLKYNTGQVETCAKCGEITISGIFELSTSDTHTFKREAKKGFGLIQDGKDEDYE